VVDPFLLDVAGIESLQVMRYGLAGSVTLTMRSVKEAARNGLWSAVDLNFLKGHA
jgi:hypothetical protein